jgi:tetratricopeptide (TPR) repeat protein
MLIGPAHGDLHGRNIIAGVVRGEAEWPAVFDFDNMRPMNLVAWDFAKLELELKCRVFPRLLNTPESLAELQRLLNIPERRPMPSSVDLSADDRRVLARVPRMEIMFEVEKVLRNWSRQISSPSDAIRGDSKRPEIPENTALGRALRIIFRIRCEAALALGYERQGRESQWYDEYHFALMTYGVIVAKWHSTTDHLAWSLLSAGVAAAGLSQLSWPADPMVSPVAECDPASGGRQSPDSAAPDFSHIATYQQLLPWAHTCWKQHRGSEPVPMLRAAISRFPYAVALRQQLALSLMGSAEFTDHEAARVEIEELFNLACVFRDHEFLSRFGRIYKDKGDQLLGESMSHQEFLHNKPLAYRHYLAAFQYYETAFQITGNYYPGINAATLALLIGNHEKQKSLAEQILALCAALPFNAPDQTWILATQGEACLLLGNTEAATHFYQSALQRIPAEETGTTNSMLNQLHRLHWALGANVVGPVLEILQEAPHSSGNEKKRTKAKQ